MSAKGVVMLGMFIGSTAGSYIPILFGASFLSMASLIGSAIGGILGIYIGYKLTTL
jgi:hypothetical protein